LAGRRFGRGLGSRPSLGPRARAAQHDDHRRHRPANQSPPRDHRLSPLRYEMYFHASMAPFYERFGESVSPPRNVLRRVAAVAAALVVVAPSASPAHEIPASVRVLAFVKASGHQLRLVVRVPLEAIRDVTFPLRGPGYLEISRTEPLLKDAAKLWIAADVE